MTGPLKAADGSVSAPSITFNSDTDTGLYRIGSNDVGFAVGGAKVFEWTSSGASVPGALSVSGAVSLGTDLAVADGGTGASTAADARTNLGVTASGADTAYALRSNNLSDVTAATAFGNIKQAASTSATGVVQTADQTAMEAKTSGRAVTADVQHFHPGHPKAWAFVLNGTTAITTSYGCASVSDDGTGQYTLTFSTAFSSSGAYTCGGGFARNTTTGCDVLSAVSAGTKTASTFKHRVMDIGSAGSDDSAESGSIYVGDL